MWEVRFVNCMWEYSDFKLNYDPGLCLEMQLNIYSGLVDNIDF